MSAILERSETSLGGKVSPLKAALVFLGIRPFTKESVQKYKEEQLALAEKSWQEIVEKEFSEARRLFLSIIFLIAVPMTVFTCCALLTLFFPSFFLPLALFAIGGTLVTVCGIQKRFTAQVILYVKMTYHANLLKGTAPEWFRTPYSVYASGKLFPVYRYPIYHQEREEKGIIEIPSHVQKIQEEINRLVSSVPCYVDHIDLCPFLVAIDTDGAEHYLEVWKEKRFQGKREV